MTYRLARYNLQVCHQAFHHAMVLETIDTAITIAEARQRAQELIAIGRHCVIYIYTLPRDIAYTRPAKLVDTIR